MTVTCPNCKKEYRIDESRVPPGGAKAKCSGCGHYFRIGNPSNEMSFCSKCGRNHPEGELCREQGVAPGDVESESAKDELSQEEHAEQPPPHWPNPTHANGSERFTPPPRGERHPSSSPVFSITEAIRFGWEATKNNLAFLVGLLIVASVIMWAPGIVQTLIGRDAVFVNFILSIISWFLQFLVAIVFIRVSLDLLDNRKPRLEEVLSNYPLVLNYIGASILYGLIVMVGSFLLIIPGIIWAIKFMFFGYVVVDKEEGPISALKKSGNITDGQKWNLFLFALALIGLNIAGALALMIGLLVTIPVSAMASAYVYRQLSSGER